MTISTTTVIAATGRTIRLASPEATIATQAVVLANNSPYQLAVAVGGDNYSLGPYMADQFATASTGQAITIVAVDLDNNPAGLPAYVVAIWYQADEAPDPASYPSTLTAPPFALGLAIAEQILETGVTFPIVQVVLADAVVMPAGSHLLLDVSQYSEAIIFVAVGGQLLIRQYDATASDILWEDALAAGFGAISPTTVALIAPKLYVGNNGGSDETVTVIASNRAPLKRLDGRRDNQVIDHWSTGTLAPIPIGISPLIQGIPSIQMQGKVFASFRLSGTSTGRFLVDDINGTHQVVCDTAQMFKGADNAMYFQQEIGWPLSAIAFLFECIGTSANGTATVDLTTLEI